MAILVQSRRFRSHPETVRTACVPIAPERLSQVMRFYVETLGLEPAPPWKQLPGGWTVGNTLRGVYFQFRHDPPVHSLRRRLTITVDSLDEVQRRLHLALWRWQSCRGLGSERWITLVDPSGHRLEIRQSRCL